VICAAAVLTFRRGGNLVAFAAAASSLASGAFFPLTLFPGWLRHLAELNPMALTLKDMRATLVNGSGWSAISGGIAALAIIAVVSLTLGTLAFRAAVARERRLGTIGLY
jgi:ABC-2 type transport system permease protein